MKNLLLLIGLILYATLSGAQCPPLVRGELNLTDQAQVDALKNEYPNCTDIPGSLVITGNVVSLANLSQIKSVSSQMIISGTNLTNLQGLENLTTIGGSMQIVNNSSLISLIGIRDLTGNLAFDIRQNSSLSSLQGLEKIKSMRLLQVQNNPSLTSFEALDSLTTVTGTVNFSGPLPITNFDGLENLVSTGDFLIQNIHSLTSLHGLEKLTHIGTFSISNNNGLTSLDGLENLRILGGLALFRTTSIASIDALKDLDSLGGVNLVFNAALSECSIMPICTYINMEGATVSIHDNLSGCSSVEEVRLGCQALPVTLAAFNAYEDEEQVRLVWETTQEINSQHFEVQRSQDAITWYTLGLVAAKGNSQQVRHYNFIDDNPGSSLNYYRLRSVDVDGSTSLSTISVIKLAHKNHLMLYPVPAAGKVWIVGEGLKNSHADLINLHGNVLKSWKLTSDRNQLETSNLPVGTYLIRMNNGTSLRFTKE